MIFVRTFTRAIIPLPPMPAGTVSIVEQSAQHDILSIIEPPARPSKRDPATPGKLWPGDYRRHPASLFFLHAAYSAVIGNG